MIKLKIKGKEYALKMSWAIYRGITKRVNSLDSAQVTDVSALTAEEMDRFLDQRGDLLVQNLWDCIETNWLGFKPFMTKGRLLKAITPGELMASDKIIGSMMSTEDRDQENSDT